MEVVIKDKIIKSDTITGIIGDNNFDVIKKINNDYSYLGLVNNHYQDTVYHELLKCLENSKYHQPKMRILAMLRFLELDRDFLKKNIKDLSLMELRLLDYLCLLINLKEVIVIYEPFKYLNSHYQRIITNYLRNLLKKYHKYIIIFSKNTNVIYELCDSYLVYHGDQVYYSDNINDIPFNELGLLKPSLALFSDLAKKKGINIGYYRDIRDLMKDVYKHV